MVQKIEWTEQSKNDLFKIKEYIASDSLFQAERTIQLIYSSVQRLISYPEIGMAIHSSEKYLVRRILVKRYRVIYLFHSDTIFVLSVQHQAQD
jgi:addiction module RelE/StbE family toxin